MTNLLSDIITYVRRIVKTPSNAVITDALIVDYINRFWMIDVDARIQLFDLKTTYQFQTTPGIDQYNMPLYSVQSQTPTSIEVPINLITEPFPDGTPTYVEDILFTIHPSDPSATLKPGTISFWFDRNLGNETLYQDDGIGNMTNTNGGPFTIGSGFIDYVTGVMTLNFTSAPGTGVPAVASFTYLSRQPGDESVAMFPVYQGFVGPCCVNGVQMHFYTQKDQFYNVWPSYNQSMVQVGTGDGTSGPYTFTLPFVQNAPNMNSVNSSIIRGHVDLTGIISTGTNQDPPLYTGTTTLITNIPTTSVFPGVYFTTTGALNNNVVISDSGVFLASNENYGCLITQGKAPYGNALLTNPFPPPANYSTTINTINYLTGVATGVYFPEAIPSGMPIMGQCVFYQTGIPRACLYYNNVITLRAPPNTQYLIQLDAYLTPAAFFNTANAIPFGYMAEYIARGAARKILSDVGDWDQFNAYEPLFQEQESLVHIRSQRQWTATRSHTIWSANWCDGPYNNSSLGL